MKNDKIESTQPSITLNGQYIKELYFGNTNSGSNYKSGKKVESVNELIFKEAVFL